jgi:hypothetical protein
MSTPYAAPHWPAGTTAEQMAECRALAKGGCELNRSEEELARAIAMIGPARLTKLVPHARHGFAVVDADMAA